MPLTITDLPCDIHDNIAAFLPDKDLIQFVCASRHIAVSAYLLRQRQRAYWKECGVKHLAETGDLAGLQYLHGLGLCLGSGRDSDDAMYNAAVEGHLAVVEFLHSIGATCANRAMDWAAENGHLAVVQYLHSIGTPFSGDAMDWAATNGHLAVVEFLHSIGAPYTNLAMFWAAVFTKHPLLT